MGESILSNKNVNKVNKVQGLGREDVNDVWQQRIFWNYLILTNMDITSRRKPNHPNRSCPKSQNWKEHYRFGQMWRICSMFSSITMAWCIKSSCQNVILSIRNITLQLCVIWEKQNDRTVSNLVTISHGHYTMRMHVLVRDYI